MKKMMLLAAFLVACAPSEKAATDTAAAMTAGPAPLMAADVAGTWTGMTMMEGSDSVISRWTVTGNGTEGKWIVEGSKDSVATTATFDADSMIVRSVTYTDPNLPNKPQVQFRSVGRLMGGKLMGTAAVRLANKPDSVVLRARWEATKSSP
jgi:hypothetical protein